jgi:hypothetical protein
MKFLTEIVNKRFIFLTKKRRIKVAKEKSKSESHFLPNIFWNISKLMVLALVIRLFGGCWLL